MKPLDSTHQSLGACYQSINEVWRGCYEDKRDGCANHNQRVAERRLASAKSKLADAIANVEDAQRLML